MGKKKRQTEKIRYTTQKVDLETLVRIKKMNFHLINSKDINIPQSELIGWAVRFALSKEADFLDYIEAAKAPEDEGLFDTIVSATGKPWLPIGNLLE